MSDKKLYDTLNLLDTEQRNPLTKDIDTAESLQIVKLINREDQIIALEIEKKLSVIASAIDLISKAFSVGVLLLYLPCLIECINFLNDNLTNFGEKCKMFLA